MKCNGGDKMISLLVLRANYGLTQSEFANIIGVSRETIINWEAGINQPRKKYLEAISNKFGVSISWLFSNNPVCTPIK
jgi:transcriptional regulator with XRE-family HTH domain